MGFCGFCGLCVLLAFLAFFFPDLAFFWLFRIRGLGLLFSFLSFFYGLSYGLMEFVRGTSPGWDVLLKEKYNSFICSCFFFVLLIYRGVIFLLSLLANVMGLIL